VSPLRWVPQCGRGERGVAARCRRLPGDGHVAEMAETAETARPDVTGGEGPRDSGPQPGGALSPADIARLAQKVYRLAVAEARLSAARGQPGLVRRRT
jgi:hypothetical protein